MSTIEALLAEFDQEMKGTRAELERLPEQDAAWKPHPKSFSLGDLAMHVANLPFWTAMTLVATEFDLHPPGGAEWKTPPFTTTAALLAFFDGNVAQARAALLAAKDADLAVPWSLKDAGQVHFTQPRGQVLRSFCFSHLVHHRAQLGVYLRLRDVPLPFLYGPTADTVR